MTTSPRDRDPHRASETPAPDPGGDRDDGELADPELADLIDDGWRLLQEGDLEAANEVVGRALERVELAPATAASPEAASRPLAEVWALRGALTAVAGDVEVGLAELSRAAAACPDSARFPLVAAEITLRAADDPAATAHLCDLALDVASEEDDLIDAVLLKVEALISLGDRDDEARDLLAELEGCAIDDAMLWCQAGDLHFALTGFDSAWRAYQRAASLDPELADAFHGIGMVHEARGDNERSARAWLRTRELDLAAQPPPWHLSGDEFEAIAARALAELPPRARELLANVPVFIEDAPTPEQILEGVDPRLFGLFTGTPLPHKSHIVDGQVPHIDTIHLYQRNLERAATSRQELADEIRITVLHETAHFFGLDDHDLDAIGLG